MAIHTQQGVHVRILRKLDDGRVVVQDIDFPTWVRDYNIWQLRADGGLAEINAAVEAAPAGPRASRMPAHLQPLDPAFIEALKKPVPEEALREKGASR